MSTNHITRRATMAAATLALLMPAAASAQGSRTVRHDEQLPKRLGLGIAVMGAQPLGELKDNIDAAGGVTGFASWALDPHGIVSVRAEAGGGSYGREVRRVSPGSQYGNLIRTDLTTSHNIANAGLGLQLAVPKGPVRPYLAALAGGSWFWTRSSLKGDNDYDQEAYGGTTNHRDAVFSWSGGGGFYIPFGKKGWGLDLGAMYQQNGTASYMTEASITDVGGVPMAGDPFTTEANMIVYRLGVRIGR